MAEERRDFNFRAEYAKSNRASCRGCRGCIPKDGLRLAKMVQSPFFDGKQPNWYHYRCFWMYVKKVESTSDIGHFDALRWEDQERIREQINGGRSGSSKAAAASKSSTKTETSEDYGVEYAKSSRSSCKACGDKIDKDELRIKYRSEEAAAVKGIPGTLDTWHHLDCFVKPDCLAAVQWPDTFSVKHLEGFKKLDADDQKLLEKKFPLKRKSKASIDEPDSKKPKGQDVDKEKEKMKAQSEKVWKIRDALRTNLTTTEMKELLEINDQEIPSGESKLLDRLSDIMTFGPLEPCSECDQGQLVLTTGGYRCQGNISSWTKCTVFTQDVKRRKKVIIPDDYEVGTYLESFKFKAYNGGKRLFPKEEAGPSKSTAPVRGSTNPLLNVAVTSAGKLSLSISVIKEIVAQLGGKYSTSVTSSTACVVSSEGEVNKRSPKITKSEALNVHVVSVEFLNEVEKGGDILKLIPQHSIAPWGSDVADRISKDETDSRGSFPSTSYRGQDYAIGYGRFNNKSVSSGVKKVQLKGGAAVDEESGQSL
ncbi:poly [ADP-ribose] polymerase 1-like [Asterias rubens]|uniref:poly [ADP-ribose] polymerase 1-like n=1 Tax=Asterias rubens TaxID=7604 RepID=UPI0014556147|nr:poly [ADP-ribose] polymerase 1-like [Asterias rubens]